MARRITDAEPVQQEVSDCERNRQYHADTVYGRVYNGWSCG